MNDQNHVSENSVRAFVVALAAAIRSFDQDLSQSQPGAFQESFLRYFDDFLSDFGPANEGHRPERWEEILGLRDALQQTLENPKLQLFDPPTGNPN